MALHLPQQVGFLVVPCELYKQNYKFFYGENNNYGQILLKPKNSL